MQYVKEDVALVTLRVITLALLLGEENYEFSVFVLRDPGDYWFRAFVFETNFLKRLIRSETEELALVQLKSIENVWLVHRLHVDQG
jgi:hypothetical protein